MLPKQYVPKHLLFVLLFLFGFSVYAQQYPVQGTLAINSPYPAYLSDYANPNIEKLILNLTLTDLNIANKRVRLKLFIQKQNSLIAQSADNIIAEPTIILDGGVPQRLTSIELGNYFKTENLQGINADAYSQALPEGVYNIGFEVYDYFTSNKLSDRITQTFWLMLNDPPLLNMPRNHENILDANPNNPQIVFQWTPRTTQVTNTEYEFTLSELWDDNGDPYQQFLAAIPKYQTTTSNTTLLYGITEPPLLAGRTYAWRVRAKAKAGFEDIGLYRQNGYSEIFIFKYAGQCAAVQGVNIEVKGYDRMYITWQPNPNQSLYKVAYRKYTAGGTWEWHETETFNSFLNLFDLEANTEYEIKVGGVCNDGLVSYSTPQTVKTLQNGQIAGINCGQAPVINLANQSLLQHLSVNEVVMAGDFPITITRVEGGNGTYSGEGWVKVPWLADTKIKVKYTGIKVNTDYKLLDGFFETTYDPTGANIGDVDEFIQDLISLFDDIKELIKNYTGTEKDKKDIADIHSQLTLQYESLINSPYLTQAEKDSLTKNFTANDHCFDALQQGKSCDSTTTNNTGHGGPYFQPDFFPPNYDCYKAGAIKLADAMAAAAKAEQLAMQKDFVYTSETGNDNNPPLTNTTPVLGISPDGKLIANIKLHNTAQKWVVVISKTQLYFIKAFDIYEGNKLVNNYTWKKNNNGNWGYYDSKMKELDITKPNEERYAYVYRDKGDKCYYDKQLVSWGTGATIENATALAAAKITESKWQKEYLFNADASCYTDFVNKIIANDNSDDCKDQTTIEQGYQQLLGFVKANSIVTKDLVTAVNTVCKSSIRKLNYQQIEYLFKLLASTSSIKEEQEVAILRLMSCMLSTDYQQFFTLLQKDNNKLLLNLVNEMHDRSLYPSDGDNRSNFFRALCVMFNKTIDKKEQPIIGINVVQNSYLLPDDKESMFSVGWLNNKIQINQGLWHVEKECHWEAGFGDDGQEVCTEVSQQVVWNVPIMATPFQPVILAKSTDFNLIAGVQGNQSVPIVPVIALYYASQKATHQNIVEYLRTFTDITTIMVPVTEVAAGANWLAKTFAFVDKWNKVNAGINLVVNSVPLKNNPAVKEVLDAYNSITLGFNVATLATGIGKAVVSKFLLAAEKNAAKQELLNLAKAGDKDAQMLLDVERELKEYGVKEFGEDWWKVGNGEGIITIATKAITKQRLPNSFMEALKKFGKTEDDILEYFTKYHNERSGQKFLNEIEDFITSTNPHNLTRDEAFALWGYTTHYFYKDLNNWLRNGENILQTTDIKNLINSGLSKLPNYSGQNIYRGIAIKVENLQDFLNSYKTGAKHTWDDFTSCGGSESASFAGRPDVNIIFEIEHISGKEISDLADGIRYGTMPRPEILIKSGSKFEVIADPIYDATLAKWKLKLIQTQ